MKVFFSFFLAQFWIFAHFFRSFSFVIAGEEEELMGANGEQHGSGTKLTPKHNESKLRPAYARHPTGDAKEGREREIKALLLLFKKKKITL